MALLNVNPTRMALMDLKNRSKSAKRGHKLLKDKQDGLMRQFLEVVREVRQLREQVEEEMTNVFRLYLKASASMTDADTQNALQSSQARLRIDIETKSVMGVKIPLFGVQQEGSMRTYGLPGTNMQFDQSVTALEELLPLLMRLAESEKKAENMAKELEVTRRRVNALEHKMIPDLQETIKFIKLKLDESERSSIVATMKVKASKQD